jgi:hypothetical protein
VTDAYDGPNIPGNPAGFIVGAINEGQSATAALNAFREAGGEMRTQTWYQMFGQVTDAIARSPLAGSLDPYSLPDPGAYATWAMGPGGEYATQVDLFFRDLDTGLVGSIPYTYVTSDPHTPEEAIAEAMGDFGESDTQAQYDQVMLGGTVRNVYTTVQFGA